MKQITWIVSCLLAMHANAQAASFDCAKASTKIEKMICGDVELSKLDDDLSATYKSALHDEKLAETVKQEQKQWVRSRNTCSEIACLKNAYTTRIAQLSSNTKIETIQRPTTIKSDSEACHVVADHMNRDTLRTLITPALPTHPTIEELRNIFGKNADFYGAISYWSMDLNNDNIPDHLVITDDGTMHVHTGFALSGKKVASIAELRNGDEMELGLDLDVLTVGGRNYVLSADRLWNLTKSGEFQSVCLFKSVGNPVNKLVSGTNNPVCSEIDPDHIHHVDYNLDHEIDELPDEERFWSKTPKDGLALVDIDNDGHPDNIVRLDFIHGAGRGCGVTYIAVTDDTRSEIPDSELNKLLLEKLGGFPCGPNLDVFILGGVTYVDADNGNHTIYRIKADKAEKVCEFQRSSRTEAVYTGKEP